MCTYTTMHGVQKNSVIPHKMAASLIFTIQAKFRIIQRIIVNHFCLPGILSATIQGAHVLPPDQYPLNLTCPDPKGQ